MPYAWGQYGSSSLVARLSGEPIQETQPYAELWYGAHPKAPSVVGSRFLNTILEEDPVGILGASSVRSFGPKLPFLAKVLSIRTALSIQAHPSLELAAELHRADPEHYPDTNHKPEVSYALSELELLHGIRKKIDLSCCPELQALIKGDNPFFELMQLPEVRVREAALELVQRLKAQSPRSPEEAWILELCDDYPEGDIGFFCFFLLDYQRLPAGSVVITPPGVPHAYLRGELFECMANSDNVLRAGLTPKHRDIAGLLRVVAQRAEASNTPRDEGVWRVLSDFTPEFELSILQEEYYQGPLGASSNVSLLLALDEGSSIGGSPLAPGQAALIPAGVEIELQGGPKLFRVRVP